MCGWLQAGLGWAHFARRCGEREEFGCIAPNGQRALRGGPAAGAVEVIQVKQEEEGGEDRRRPEPEHLHGREGRGFS